jgi:ankyrin repeat protein
MSSIKSKIIVAGMLLFTAFNAKTEISESFIDAVYDDNISLIDVYLVLGADIEYLGTVENTALLLAAKKNNLQMMQLLIDNGANINAQNHYGISALMYAVDSRNVDMVTLLLLDNNIDVDLQSNKGCTALMLAAKHNRLDLVQQLVNAGAALSIQDNNGCDALCYANQRGFQDIVDYLESLSEVVL